MSAGQEWIIIKFKGDFMDDIEYDEDGFEIIPSEKQDETEDTSTYEIISYGADFTLSGLHDKMNAGKIIVPDFQRRYVWNINQASRLVESFLLGLPVPGIFLAKEKDTGNLLVLDGQQRLVTCKAFREEMFPITNRVFSLKNVNEKWVGKKYSELDTSDQNRFDDSVLRATITQQIHPEDDSSIYHIFQRLNAGGTFLQNQEIRNCLYHGNFNEMLKELNLNETWRNLYNSKKPNKRMKDEELILRFLALHYNFQNYSKPMNEFLSNFMDNNRNISMEDSERMKKIFIETISFIYEKVGIDAFRPRGNINTAAFDSITYVIANFKSELDYNISDNIKKLFQDIGYLKAIGEGTTDPETIKNRFEIAKKYLLKYEL